MNTYKIAKVQLPIVGGLAGHNFIVLFDDKNQVIGELHGLATKKQCNEFNEPDIKPIGYLLSDRLKFHEIDPTQRQPFYKNTYPKEIVFEGTKDEVIAKWEAAIGTGWAINRQDLHYPILGVLDLKESPFNGPENSNSVTSTLLKAMDLPDPPLGLRLTPGEGKQLLTEEALQAIRDNPLQNQDNPICTPPQPKNLSENIYQQSHSFISQGFMDLLSDNPEQGINQILDSHYAKTFDIQSKQILAQDEIHKQQEVVQVQELDKSKMIRS